MSPVCRRCSQPGSVDTSACVNVWLPSSKPCRCRLRTRSGCRTTSLPTTKKVAGTCRRRNSAAIFGVQRGSGPSSNVSAMRLPGAMSLDWRPPGPQARTGPSPARGPARSRHRRRAPPSGARGQALDREQGQQREEEQPEDDPAGDGPRRFAQVRPSSAAVEAEAALRPSWPGRAERQASAQAAASCGRPDGLGSWPEAVAARPSGAALAAPGSPYAPNRECAVRG